MYINLKASEGTKYLIIALMFLDICSIVQHIATKNMDFRVDISKQALRLATAKKAQIKKNAILKKLATSIPLMPSPASLVNSRKPHPIKEEVEIETITEAIILTINKLRLLLLTLIKNKIKASVTIKYIDLDNDSTNGCILVTSLAVKEIE